MTRHCHMFMVYFFFDFSSNFIVYSNFVLFSLSLSRLMFIFLLSFCSFISSFLSKKCDYFDNKKCKTFFLCFERLFCCRWICVQNLWFNENFVSKKWKILNDIIVVDDNDIVVIVDNIDIIAVDMINLHMIWKISLLFYFVRDVSRRHRYYCYYCHRV